jgi:8-oxo-dGTP pyrophosphatase MutT (NUDIX family)
MSITNRIILVKGRRTGKWSFPKGHKLRNESYLSCALRETFEETGIKLDGIRHIACHKLSVGEYYFYELEDEVELCPCDTGEVEEAGWFGIDEIKAMNCNVDVNNFLDRLKRARRKVCEPLTPLTVLEEPVALPLEELLL